MLSVEIRVADQRTYFCERFERRLHSLVAPRLLLIGDHLDVLVWRCALDAAEPAQIERLSIANEVTPARVAECIE